MCGRTACGLDPDRICNACKHKQKDGKNVEPKMANLSSRVFYPSYNICPGSSLMTLISADHLSSSKPEIKFSSADEVEWILMPMRWGLIPSWHTGDIKSVAYKMNNARSDGVMEKKTFRAPLDKGRRCAVIAEGYFEWQTGKGDKKQPYFIYPPPVESKIEGSSFPELDNGKRLIVMAGIFDIWRDNELEEPLYSVAIITVDAHTCLSFIHDRMPALLNGEEEVSAWLDYKNVPLIDAMKLIYPKDCVTCHPVSRSLVGDVKNKSIDCIMKIDINDAKDVKKPIGSSFMKTWLSQGSPSTKLKRPSLSNDDNDESVKKLNLKSSN